jgi:hypothetical protein
VEAQEELAEIALEIDAGFKGGVYHATPEELDGVDRGAQGLAGRTFRDRRRS